MISEAAAETGRFRQWSDRQSGVSTSTDRRSHRNHRDLNIYPHLTAQRFQILIAELKAIEDSFDDPAEFAQALEGLELGSQVALRGIDRQISEVGLGQIGTAIGETDFEISQLFEELEDQTTASGVREAINRLRTAITEKYQLMRDKINGSADTEEEKTRQIEQVTFKKVKHLSNWTARTRTTEQSCGYRAIFAR